MPRFIRIWLFSTLISFTALGMWKGLEWYYNRGSEDDPPIVLTSVDLALSYEQDTSFSALLYNGKYVLLTGVITNKGDAGDYYTVNLEGSSYFSIDLSFYDIDEIALLNDINIGDTITVMGKVLGLNLLYIQITDCSLE